MAISGTITLSSASTNMSTFDLYGCTSSSNSSCSGTAFETNVTRSQLLNGFVSNIIPDGTMYIKINPNIDGCLNQYIIVELSGVPAVSQTPTKTPTPTQTQTPTPTISVGCISISESTDTTQDVRCPDDYSGEYYNRTTNTVTVQLLDSYGGSPIVASQNIQVSINIDYYAIYQQGGGGGYSPYVETVTILSGQTQTTFQYESQTTLANPYDGNCEQETKSIVGIESISPNTFIECAPIVSLTPTKTPTPTPTPTEGTIPLGTCWTLVYDNLLPTDLYVRYRDNSLGTTVTELINGLEVIPNGDGTYTTAICVAPIPASYSIPVFVQGGIEQAGGSYDWVMGGECTTAPICLLN